MKKLKHSKCKNTLFLHTVLIQQAVRDVMQSKKPNSNAYKIFNKYFNKNSLLHQQYKLYKTLYTPPSVIDGNSQRAKEYVQTVIKSYNKLDKNKITMLKYNLIKQIKQHYDIDVMFQMDVDDYKIYASINKLFESQSYQYQPVGVIQNKYLVVQNVATRTKKNQIQQDKEIKKQTQKQSLEQAVQQFNDKYSMVLNESQKRLVKIYIGGISDSKGLLQSVQKQIDKINTRIDNVLAKSSKNQVLKIKLKQIQNQLSKVKSKKVIKESTIIGLLQIHQLFKEMASK